MPKKDPNPKYNYKELYPNTYKLAEGLTTYVPGYKKYTPENFIDMLQLISNAETGNKNIAQMGGGPGRGFYQMEKKSSKVAKNRAANINNDLINLGYKQGITIPQFNEDFTKLSKDDQAVYVLSNMVKAASSKRATNPNAYVNPLDPKGSWVQYHWAGKAEDKPAREKHWDEVNSNSNDILNNIYNQEYSNYSKQHGVNNTEHPITITPKIMDAPEFIEGAWDNTQGGWLDKFANGGDVPSKYNTIPTSIIKPPKIVYTTSGSRYMPEEQTIYLNPEEDYYDPSIYQHEMFHHWQNLNDKLRKPDEYEGPLAKPSIVANEEAQMDYYNRRNVETKEEFDKLYKQFPVFRLTAPYLIYDKKVNPELYKNPKYAEGEAEEYQDYIKGGGTPAFMAKGGLIKRADGSYSRRGLWDNIRANRGSGRKPTAEMLRQERKIKKHDDGSWVTDSSLPTPTTPSFYPAYPDKTLTNYQMGTDKAPMYGGGGGVNPIYVTNPNDPRLKAYNDSLSLYNQGLINKKQYLNFINNLNLDTSNLVSGPLLKSKTSNKIQPITHTNLESWGAVGTSNGPLYTIYKGKDGKDIQIDKEDVISKINKGYLTYKKPVQPIKLKKEEIEPISRKFDFSVNEDIQPIASTPYVPNPVRRVMNPSFQESDYTDKHNSIVDPLGNPKYKYYNQDKVITQQEYNDLMQKKANGGPVMYNAGSTVWTNQNTPLWAAGTPTPTATQNFRNDRSLNTDLYRIGDIIPTGMDYKTPAAGTYDYSKDIQPYYTMRLHAPDTTMMARHGGHIKKHINSPRVYGSPVNPSGMSEGPTMQRGTMMFGNGSTVEGECPQGYTKNNKGDCEPIQGAANQFQEARDYYKGWFNSPIYKQIIQKQAEALYGDNEKKKNKFITNTLESNISNWQDSSSNTIGNPYLQQGLRDKEHAFGTGSAGEYTGLGTPITLDLDFVKNNPTLANSLYAHELAHKQTYTPYDFEYILKNTPKYPGPGKYDRNGEWHDITKPGYAYFTDPDEVRTEIHAVRQLAKQAGIYDPYTEPFTKEHLDKVSKLFNEGGPEGKPFNQLERLRFFYPDDEKVIDMMNTISQNNNKPTNNTQMAKRGGYVKNNNSNTWLDQYN